MSQPTLNEGDVVMGWSVRPVLLISRIPNEILNHTAALMVAPYILVVEFHMKVIFCFRHISALSIIRKLAAIIYYHISQ